MALADPTRRSVFDALRGGPRAVGDLAAELPVTRPAVSQHLKRLKEVGLVTQRAEGTRRFYEARPEGLEPLRRYLDGTWGDVMGAFANHMETRGGASRARSHARKKKGREA